MSSTRMPFQYVVLRCVPRVDREEFVNVGVVLYCQQADFLSCASHVDPARLLALDPSLDVDAVRSALAAVEAVCAGGPEGGAAAALPEGQRFRWLVAPRSTVVQPGPVHTGMTGDLEAETQRLLARLVLQP